MTLGGSVLGGAGPLGGSFGVAGSTAGPVANITMGAPAGVVVQVPAGPTAGITLGAPAGTFPGRFIRDPLHVALVPSVRSAIFAGPNRAVLHPNVQGETF